MWPRNFPSHASVVIDRYIHLFATKSNDSRHVTSVESVCDTLQNGLKWIAITPQGSVDWYEYCRRSNTVEIHLQKPNRVERPRPTTRYSQFNTRLAFPRYKLSSTGAGSSSP